MDWHTLIADTGNYKDDLDIPAPNGEKVKLGDLRKAFNARQSEIDQRAGELRAGEKQINDARQELVKVYQDLEQKERELAARMAAVPTPTAGGPDVYADEYLRPLVQKIESLEAAKAELEGALKTVTSNQFASAKTYLENRWVDEARALKAELGDALEDSWTYDKLAKYAYDHGYKDSNNIPNLRKAAMEITEPKRLEKMAKEAEEKGYSKAKEEIQMRNLVGPASGVLPRAAQGGPQTFKTIAEAFSAAGKDPSVWLPQ